MQCGGSGGCQGAIPQLGYSYIQLFGLTTAKEYPYWSGVTMITGITLNVYSNILNYFRVLVNTTLLEQIKDIKNINTYEFLVMLC